MHGFLVRTTKLGLCGWVGILAHLQEPNVESDVKNTMLHVVTLFNLQLASFFRSSRF